MALWLYWIILGLLAGALAKFLMPGRDPAGCIFTIVLGVVGAFLGGWVGTRLGWGRVTVGTLDLRSIGIATFGAIILLAIGRLLRRGGDSR
ncbi:MAG: GlsB/YeaQ/YmgE family stress response membrane protein [Gemmatimonadaceae bacterium]|nr:GlsB/YeaQ/YmgE family stress response membrane protein [Gemmatimonadaceae bacterium]NUQ94261.1 GlsB/YeaQ/YmgE family stress response membrane protein [Gemmatimonadaceae bacterium]NUR34770.1 GlsB/YeaQ/YmgE family stress response membrane protein [Gemmatimonadaceae bacterium]NUS96833.1 GlsB/YeaQ/YmgE family stress response membrane protein [Gemmatimonadaceae bacterium]